MLIRLIQRLIINKIIMLTITVLLLVHYDISISPENAIALDSYEGYYLFLGDYPHFAQPGWHENVQGIAHDANNWFITQTTALWKIPVTRDLDQSVTPNDPGVLKIDLNNLTNLTNEGYNHFGDLEYYERDGIGYVFIGIEKVDPSGPPPFPAIAVFRADNLGYIDHAYVPQQPSAGWCAVDPTNGEIYSFAGDNVAYVYKYKFDWDALKDNGTLILSGPTGVNLYDENGSPFTSHRFGQGGVISPSGELLYLIGGFYDEVRPNDGIHVFDLKTGKRVQRSINGDGYFNYEWHTGWNPFWGCITICEEPEGLTIWDLDADGRAPGISGQLHVLMLDNDLTPDEVYIKHYTLNISVDKNYTGIETGTPPQPFNTVNEAINTYPAWDGAQIKIKAGSYPETISTSNRVRIISNGGTSTIGQ